MAFIQPCPLQLFCPLQALVAVLQAELPLHELMPLHFTETSAVDSADGEEEALQPLIITAAAAAIATLETLRSVFILYPLKNN